MAGTPEETKQNERRDDWKEEESRRGKTPWKDSTMIQEDYMLEWNMGCGCDNDHISTHTHLTVRETERKEEKRS